jgi:hypothetical protein
MSKKSTKSTKPKPTAKPKVKTDDLVGPHPSQPPGGGS